MMNRAIFLVCILCVIFPSGSAHAKSQYSYNGEIDFSEKRFDLILDSGEEQIIGVKGEYLQDQSYQFSLNVEHLQTSRGLVSTELKGIVDLTIEGISADLHNGKIWSQYTLLDYKPIDDFFIKFEKNGDLLWLDSFSFGALSCRGKIDIQYPYKHDLVFNLSGVEMQQFIGFWLKNKTIDSSGLVSGKIQSKGNIDKVFLKGNLESFEGHIKKLKFDSIYLNAEGVYPEIELAHSTLSKTEGFSFTLDGKIDLSDQKNFIKQVKALRISPLISESNSQKEWTLKRYIDEEKGTTELKYMLRKDSEVNGPPGSGEGMLGLEKTIVQF